MTRFVFFTCVNQTYINRLHFHFMTEVFKELDIIDKIDYDEQFDKSFVEPLKAITEKMDWLIDSGSMAHKGH